MFKLHNDDCLKILRTYPDNYFDSIVTDPPAGIGFMGKDWDHDKGGRDKWIEWMTAVAAECLRTLKPGGHACVWALPRTSHWTATAWEDAGFEVRDRISHIFGSGFPKSYDIAKGIEGILTNGSASWNDFHKLNGEIIDNGSRLANGMVKINANQGNRPTEYKSRGKLKLEATTDEARQWDGWGTALKPAMEDWWLFRKPCSEKTVAANVLKWGTGALNIDACRVPGNSIINKLEKWSGFGQVEKPEYEQEVNSKGRWPAQIIHDGSDEVVGMFPDSNGNGGKTSGEKSTHDRVGKFGLESVPINRISDTGSAARFFYCAKPTQAERNFGLSDLKETDIGHNRFDKCLECGGYILQNKNRPSACQCETPRRKNNIVKGNSHPTVKAKALMQYLVTLITPPKGIVLDCFMGSGSTGVAAISLGFSFVGIENDTESGYFEIAQQRLKYTQEPFL